MTYCATCKRPPKTRLRKGKCSACYEWERRHGTSEARKSRHWTEHEHNYVLYQLGYKTLPQIAKALNRTPAAVRYYVEQHRLRPRDCAKRRDGMCAADVSAALGVSKWIVHTWMQRGWLKASKAKTTRQWYYTLSHDDVRAFLFERGGLLRLEPSCDWRDIYEAARAALLGRYVNRGEIMRVLFRSSTMLNYWRDYKGFPAPAHAMNARYGGFYYDRAAVREWLERHPEYRTKRAREI